GAPSPTGRPGVVADHHRASLDDGWTIPASTSGTYGAWCADHQEPVTSACGIVACDIPAAPARQAPHVLATSGARPRVRMPAATRRNPSAPGAARRGADGAARP